MTNYKILIEGYGYEGKNGNFFASPTTALIESNSKKIIMDPGASKEKLITALAEQKLSTSDIDILFLTHYHPDHFLNLKLFPDQDLYDASMLWKSDEEIEYSALENYREGYIPGTDVQIIATPGHSSEHCSLLFNTEDEGTVCLAQDVFWWVDGEQKTDDYEELVNYEDPFANDFEALKESRKKVLTIADWIIPGHGKKFKNEFRGVGL